MKDPHDIRKAAIEDEIIARSEEADEAIHRAAFKFAEDRIKQLESENAALIKFIEQCSEDRYARVACREWVRKRKVKHE